jgi:hypothetical protein
MTTTDSPILPAREQDPVLAPYQPTEAPTGVLFTWVLPYLGGYLALLALPVLLWKDVPFAAWAIAVGLWLLNRLGHVATVKSVGGLPQAMAVGAAGFGMMMRVWIVTFVLFFVGADLHAGGMTLGLGKPDVAVPAMLVFMLCFTFDIASRAMIELRRYKTSDATAGAMAQRDPRLEGELNE